MIYTCIFIFDDEIIFFAETNREINYYNYYWELFQIEHEYITGVKLRRYFKLK